MKLYPYQRAMVDSLLSPLTQTIQFSQPLHPRSWTPLYYQKEKLMKEGPYKSSTYGDIPLSVRGRELLQILRMRQEACAEQASCAFSTPRGYDLAEARGELAKYMSELESYAEGFHYRAPSDVRRSMGEPPQVVKRPKTATEVSIEKQNELFDDRRAKLLKAFRLASPIFAITQETPVKYPEIIGSNSCAAGQQINKAACTSSAANPVEKTRGDLIGEATRELVQAQRNLERLQSEVGQEVGSLSLSSDLLGYCQTTAAVAKLVNEQWPALVKKAVARAKSRVAKAEKAVATLLS